MKKNHLLKKYKKDVIKSNIETIKIFLEDIDKKILSDLDIGIAFNKYIEIYEEELIFSFSRLEFINILLELEIIEKINVKNSKKIINRYLFTKKANVYEKALSLSTNSYLSHYTAVFMHGLTLNVPKTIYINTEQTKKNNKINQNGLRQLNIDKAFSREFRRTNNISILEDDLQKYKVIMVNGKYLGNKNITTIKYKNSILPISSVERTLIDIIVRPDYSGGVTEVIDAFKSAKSNISVSKLINILDQSEYIYPYHQSLGFYLERAGYSERELDKLSKYKYNLEFYLTYQMINPKFSERWKIYYPNYIWLYNLDINLVV